MIEINGLKHSVFIEDELLKVKQQPKKKPRSTILSKYYALNARNVSAFCRDQLYATYPEQFNDIFDGNHERLYLNNNWEFYQNLHKYEGLSLDQISKHKIDFDSNPMKYNEKYRNTLFAIWNSHMGLVSMTESQKSDLMWAHYCDNRGYTVEYDYRMFDKRFTGPYKMNYLSESKFGLLRPSDLTEQIIMSVLSKKWIWRYEKEWRFIVYPGKVKSFHTPGQFSNQNHLTYPRTSRLISIPQNSVKGIILGFSFFQDTSRKETMQNGIEIELDSNEEGLLREALLSNIINKNIKTSIIFFEKSSLKLIKKKITLTNIGSMKYLIQY